MPEASLRLDRAEPSLNTPGTDRYDTERQTGSVTKQKLRDEVYQVRNITQTQSQRD